MRETLAAGSASADGIAAECLKFDVRSLTLSYDTAPTVWPSPVNVVPHPAPPLRVRITAAWEPV